MRRYHRIEKRLRAGLKRKIMEKKYSLKGQENTHDFHKHSLKLHSFDKKTSLRNFNKFSGSVSLIICSFWNSFYYRMIKYITVIEVDAYSADRFRIASICCWQSEIFFRTSAKKLVFKIDKEHRLMLLWLKLSMNFTIFPIFLILRLFSYESSKVHSSEHSLL